MTNEDIQDIANHEFDAIRVATKLGILAIQSPRLNQEGDKILGEIRDYDLIQIYASGRNIEIPVTYSINVQDIQSIIVRHRRTPKRSPSDRDYTLENLGLPQMARKKTNSEMIPVIIGFLVIGLIFMLLKGLFM